MICEADSAKYTIEHVLPEHSGEDWLQFNEQQQARFVYRLGNLTLLNDAANRDLGNCGFTGKRRVFRDSEFAITQRLADECDHWNPQALGNRQRWMAKQACTIWRLNL